MGLGDWNDIVPGTCCTSPVTVFCKKKKKKKKMMTSLETVKTGLSSFCNWLEDTEYHSNPISNALKMNLRRT